MSGQQQLGLWAKLVDTARHMLRQLLMQARCQPWQTAKLMRIPALICMASVAGHCAQSPRS